MIDKPKTAGIAVLAMAAAAAMAAFGTTHGVSLHVLEGDDPLTGNRRRRLIGREDGTAVTEEEILRRAEARRRRKFRHNRRG